MGRLTREDIAHFIDWVNQRTPHPLDELTPARLAKFSPAQQEILLRIAADKAELRRSYNSPHIQGAIQSPEGVAKLFALVLQKKHKDLSDLEATQLYDTCIAEHGETYLRDKIQRTQGVYDPGQDEEDEFIVKKK